MFKSLILIVIVAQSLYCDASSLIGAPVPLDGNGKIPEFGRALKLAKFNKQIVEITSATQQVVSGVLYKVQFTTGPISCFDEIGYSTTNECNDKKESCELSYVVQSWKKVDLTLAGSGNVNCQRNELESNQDIEDPDLHEEPYNKTTDASLRDEFDRFIYKYGRDYSPDSNDGTYWKRFTVFKKNVKTAWKLNKSERGTAKYGVTKFMDYTELEFKKYCAPGFQDEVVKLRKEVVEDVHDTPTSFDWRDKGAVTPVKNQGQCGSCWAFSTTGNIEGQWFLKKGKLVSLSEQELVDCDTVDQGCNGGLPSNAYQSIEKLGGLETEGDYPYDARGEKCNLKPSEIAAYINDSVSLPQDEVKLATWLSQNGPISIGINAFAMQFYMGGISHPWKFMCNPKSLDHGVLIVGYGVYDTTPYWIIKNSWGPGWGEKGYYRIYRGDGSCGVNQMATSSIVD